MKCGDIILYTGTLYTARDQAHIRLEKMIKNNEKIPVDFKDSLIYYAGPTPTKPNGVVGSIGPTTSSRMDSFSYMMKTLGVKGTIGKGPRSDECRLQYKEDKIVYYIATGGIGAKLSKCVTSCEVVAFDDLGTESIKKLTVKDFPLMVAFDYEGNSIFWKEGK